MQEARESSRKFVGGLNLGNDFRRRFQANNGPDSPHLPLNSPALTYDAMANMHMIPTNLLTPGIGFQSPMFSQGGHFSSSPGPSISGFQPHATSPMISPHPYAQQPFGQYFENQAVQLPIGRTVYIGNIPEGVQAEYDLSTR